MKKIALLVEFAPMTRLILEVPDGTDEEKFLEDNADLISRTAREKMSENLGDYLYGDNMSFRPDTEVPADQNEEADQDPENPVVARAGFGFRNRYGKAGVVVYRTQNGKSVATEIDTELTARQITAADADSFVAFCCQHNLI